MPPGLGSQCMACGHALPTRMPDLRSFGMRIVSVSSKYDVSVMASICAPGANM